MVTANNSVSALTATTSVTITDVPITGLTATNDSPTELGNLTTLTAAVETGSNVVYTWAFGDGETGNGPVVSHTYPVTGVYTAVVTANNSVSALTATTSVTVTEHYHVYLPAVLRAHPQQRAVRDAVLRLRSRGVEKAKLRGRLPLGGDWRWD